MSSLAQRRRGNQDETANYNRTYPLISSIIPRNVKQRVAQPTSDWFVELQDRFDELTALEKGWDGYTGLPVSFNCALFAANLIERLFVANVPKPSLVPGSDGTIQIEWHRNQFDIEIHVLGPNELIASRYDHRTGHSLELELENDFSELGEWIVDLQRDATVVDLAGA